MNTPHSDRFIFKLATSLLLIMLVTSFWSCENRKESNVPEIHKTQVNFQYEKIDTAGPHNPWAKFSGDLNGDGIIDIIIGGQKGPLVWYEYPVWSMHQIAEGGYDTVDGDVGDLDQDGDLDIIMGGIIWYENPGNLLEVPDQAWNAHRIAHHPTHDIEIADIDQNHLPDIISRDQSEFGSKRGNSIHIWVNLGDDQWNEEVIECPHGEGISVSDLDSDLDPDIVIGGIWFENDLSDGQMKWTEHHFTDWHSNASVQVVDINLDDRNDIVLVPAELAGSYHKISWFEAPADLSESGWIEHVILDTIECVIHSLSTGDLDNNGYVDLAYAEMHQGTDPDEVVLLLNAQKGETWVKQIISQNGSHGLRIADVNNDQLLDVFGANWSGDYQPIEVWLNTTGIKSPEK